MSTKVKNTHYNKLHILDMNLYVQQRSYTFFHKVFNTMNLVIIRYVSTKVKIHIILKSMKQKMYSLNINLYVLQRLLSHEKKFTLK